MIRQEIPILSVRLKMTVTSAANDHPHAQQALKFEKGRMTNARKITIIAEVTVVAVPKAHAVAVVQAILMPALIEE